MEEYTIKANATLLDALKILNNLSDSGLTLFVRNKEAAIIGTITDGDIRRHLISGGNIEDRVSIVFNHDFSYFSITETDIFQKFRQFKQHKLRLIPILGSQKELISVCNLDQYKSMLPIDAVLMAGGKGERLRPFTEKTPKPLLKVGEKAIIDYNVDNLLQYGIKHINVTINYLGEQLEDHFKEPQLEVQVKCIKEPEFLGTIGAIKFIETWHNDTILVMNSDLFTNINLEDFFMHFSENNADMSIAAIPYSVNIPYGILEIDGVRNIKRVNEKPNFHYYANAGIYLIKRSVLDMIPNNIFFNATDLMELLIAKGKNVIRFPLSGYWIDIGKPEDFKKAQEFAKHVNK